MKILVLDVETTIFAKGNPNSIKNKLCYVGLYDGVTCECIPIEYGLEPYAKSLEYIKKRIEEADVVVGFNIKFDLNWIKRYINDLIIGTVFDTQLCEFILGCQLDRYLSLDEVCARYNIPPKLDVVRTTYWDNGIDTDAIPSDILEEYLRGDLDKTYAIYCEQVRILEKSTKKTLVEISNEDLLTLQLMEEAGLPTFDEEEAKQWATKIDADLEANGALLDSLLVPPCVVNWDSPQQVSTVLFGGTITERVREHTERVLKDGTVKTGERWGEREHIIQGKINPIGSKGQSGFYSVDDDTLQKLQWKTYRKVQSVLQDRRGISKLRSTYLEGLIHLRTKQDWAPGKIYPTYNQTVVVTGRLASSKPNGQNIPYDIRKLFKVNK